MGLPSFLSLHSFKLFIMGKCTLLSILPVPLPWNIAYTLKVFQNAFLDFFCTALYMDANIMLDHYAHWLHDPTFLYSGWLFLVKHSLPVTSINWSACATMIFLNLLLKYPVYYPYCALFWMFFMNLLHQISTWWTRPIHGSNAATYQQSVITIIIDLDSNGVTLDVRGVLGVR